ncbi:MAG: DNA repair protein RecO [Lachnospiraceae bacterium]|nr:DNA repair protein RecO [Lachnospiraceae bacterium]
MQEFVCVTGIILKQMPVGEYDRRITLLTKERGKLSAFARGARKQGSRFGAATNPFCFGIFKLYEGRTAYTVSDVEIQNFFESLMKDYIGACYGMYFAEIADYYTRENNDESRMLKLLYQTLRALCSPSLQNELIKCIYELKAIEVNGEYPGVPSDISLLESTVYAMNYIEKSPIEKLYTFAVSGTVLKELQTVAAEYCRRFMDCKFKSLEILKTLC